jgi:cysteine desulfurase/selenocysteine lyase
MTSRRDFLSTFAGAGMAGVLRSPPARWEALDGSAPWRRAFPALNERVRGYPLIYLDNAATTHRAQAVLQAEMEYYWHANANPASSMHELARRAGERYEAARQTLATFLNAPDPAEIVWCRGTTEAINLVASSWGHSTLRPGDEILLSLADHHSSLLPWQQIAQRTGAVLRFVDVDDDGVLKLDHLERLLSPRTRLLCLAHVSNVFGRIQPVAEIGKRVHDRGALLFLDGAQSAPHMPIDVQALGCDFFALSGHKMAGPMGIGALWARRELLEAMPPYQLGGHMATRVDLLSAEFASGAHKFEAGSPNIAGPVAWGAAIGFLRHIGLEKIRTHHSMLVKHTLERLAGLHRLSVFGSTAANERVGIVSFGVEGVDPVTLARGLDQRGIAIRAGDLAAAPLLRSRGRNALARVSLYLYNEPAEIDRLAEELERLGA